MSTIKSMSIEELVARNEALRDAVAIARDTVSRHQHNVKKIRALRRAAAAVNPADFDHTLLMELLSDLVEKTETQVDGELLTLELQLGRVNQMQRGRVDLSIVP